MRFIFLFLIYCLFINFSNASQDENTTEPIRTAVSPKLNEYSTTKDEYGIISKSVQIAIPTLTKSAFYSAASFAGEWLAQGVGLFYLNSIISSKVNKNFFGLLLRAQWFIDNKDAVIKYSGYIGSTVGVFFGISVTDYFIPAVEYISCCWMRCGTSLLDWDSSKSSRRDRVILFSSSALLLISMYYRNIIFETIIGNRIS